MKKYIYKISLFLAVLVFVTGCQEEYPIMFDTSEILVGLNETNLSIRENETGSFSIYLGGAPGVAATDVNIEVSTDGISKPAIEDTDYTISSKTVSVSVGMTEITITPIDNDVFQGNKQFKIGIASNSKSYPLSKQSVLTVTIVDDEHPLKAFIGTYKVDAVSYTVPGAWDESWTVVASPVEGDPTKLSLRGIGVDVANAIIATFDTQNLTVTIAGGQVLGSAYASWGYPNSITIHKGTPDVTLDLDAAITGTIQLNGNMAIDNWGHLYDEDPGEDYVFDVYNTTWTKQP